MLKNYVLANEVAKKGNFNISNISMALKEFGLEPGADYLKYGGMVLLNRKSNKIPRYIAKVIENNELSNLENYIPLKELKEIFNNRLAPLKGKYKEIILEGKHFVEITDEKIKEIILNDKYNKMVIDQKELNEMIKDDLIEGNIPISKNKALIWY